MDLSSWLEDANYMIDMRLDFIVSGGLIFLGSAGGIYLEIFSIHT